MNKFCLLRHGETLWNRELRLQGHTDIPLSDLGIYQAHKAGKLLLQSGHNASHIVSSDLLRASQTADILASRLGLQVIFDEDLRERDIGRLTGMTLPVLSREQPEDYRRYIEGCRHTCFGHGESLVTFEQRVITAIWRHLSMQPIARTIIFVCHEGVVRAVQTRLGNQQPVLNGEAHWFSGDMSRLLPKNTI